MADFDVTVRSSGKESGKDIQRSHDTAYMVVSLRG
jgi:hypothetical protein